MSTVKSKNLQVGTDATASNNFTIYQPSTPDGTLRIGVGNADSPTEVGRFTSAGYKPATVPAFYATASAGQTISESTSTKIAFNTEVFDTNSNYDTSNYRFTPTVAGYYQVNCHVLSGGTTAGQYWSISVKKNGTNVVLGSNGFSQLATVGGATNASVIVYMNGSTDYVESYIYHKTSGSSLATQAGSTEASHFSGILIAQA